VGDGWLADLPSIIFARVVRIVPPLPLAPSLALVIAVIALLPAARPLIFRRAVIPPSPPVAVAVAVAAAVVVTPAVCRKMARFSWRRPSIGWLG
jgi:hypothetical protein